MSSGDAFWPRRLRWRLRGAAWQWPAYAVLTVADAAILHTLPPSRTGFNPIAGLIVASFANLFLIGAVAPWLARRRVAHQAAARGEAAGALSVRAPPYEVVLSRIAAGLCVVATLGLLAVGLASRPLIVSETEATEANARAVRDYVLAHGPPEAKRNLDAANTVRLAEGFFRTCVASDDRRRAFCMFVDTNRRPVLVRPDPSPLPNSEFLGGGEAG